MATIASLTDTYTTQGNYSLSDTSTALVIHQGALWAIKAFLMDHLPGGTMGGTRHADSVWTCLGSSDGVTGALDGVDRWTTSFNPSKIVGAASGSAHSWIALRNAASGYDVAMDVNTAGASSVGMYATKSSAGLTGGSVTVRPATPGDTESFMAGTNALTPTSGNAVWGDTSLSTPHNLTFVTGTTGARWYMLGHRTGTGIAHSFLAFWQGIGGDPSDTRNQWWAKSTSTSGRGAPAVSSLIVAPSGLARRTPTNTSPYTQGGARQWNFGGYAPSNTIDVLRNQYFVSPIECANLTPGSTAYYGTLADMHHTSGGAVGGSYPSVGAMVRHVVGEFVLPCSVPIVT